MSIQVKINGKTAGSRKTKSGAMNLASKLQARSSTNSVQLIREVQSKKPKQAKTKAPAIPVYTIVNGRVFKVRSV